MSGESRGNGSHAREEVRMADVVMIVLTIGSFLAAAALVVWLDWI